MSASIAQTTVAVENTDTSLHEYNTFRAVLRVTLPATSPPDFRRVQHITPSSIVRAISRRGLMAYSKKMLSLPLWVVTEHIQPSDPDSIAKSRSCKALAFSSSERLLKFMKANLGGEWKMQMADDHEGLVILVADLHRLQVESLTLNPENNGNGGEPVTLTDLAAFVDSLTK